MTDTLRLARVWAGWSLGTASALLVLLVIGRMVPSAPLVALVLALVVHAVGLTAAEPAIIPLLAIPALLSIFRVGPLGYDVALSDLVLLVAAVPAVFLAARPYSPPLRTVLWLSAFYQVMTLFTVIANPYTANTVEWFHTWLLVSGAAVVGWSVGRSGYARAGLTLLVLTAGFLAAITIVQGVQLALVGNLQPVYVSWPYGMHKNFVGPVLAFTAVILYVRPVWMGWSRRWALLFFWLCATGLALTQSRQGLITLGVALLFVVLRRDPDRTRSKVIVVAVVPAVAFVAFTIKDQVESGNKFNSVFQRLTWFRDSLEVWGNNPFVGVGLRWWYTDRFPVRFQPPNAEIEVLTTSGVVGLVGFVVLMVGTLLVMWRVDPRYGTLATAVFVALLVQAQMDGFWQAVRPSLPFLIAGICLGAQARSAEGETLLASLSEHTAGTGPSPVVEPGSPARVPVSGS